MQPQGSSPIARRALDFDDYLDMLRRRGGWILGSVFAALVVSVVTAFLWPDTYVSVATIRVVPPQVPENFVPANVNIDLQGRVNSLVQLILNRATLTNIINTHGLYKREVARLPIDEVIDDMRLRDIKVLPVQLSFNQGQSQKQQYPAFEIRFAYNDRFIAQKVAADMVARFLEENVREVSQETFSTTQFLRDQWDAAKKKLDDLEQRLSVFRSRHMGRLPEEQQNNYQELTALETQKLNLNISINRVNQEKLLGENQLRIYRDQLASLKDSHSQEPALLQKNESLAEKDREISRYEDELAAARQRYRENHPDVERLAGLLAAAKKQREIIQKQDQKQDESKPSRPPLPTASSPQFVREQRELEALIERTRGLLQAKDLELEDYRKQAVELDATTKNYQARIQGVPIGMKDYDELIRDRDLATKDYEDLDRRLNSSAMSTALENRQQGERLEQLDPPSLPQTAAEPKRAAMIAVGTAIGLIAGLCLAGAREMRDATLKNLRDVRACTEQPILGGISLIENRSVERRRRGLVWLTWSAACSLGLIVMSGSVVYYFVTKL
jgi:succinoglycan biosynthesis transport protein ExoP